MNRLDAVSFISHGVGKAGQPTEAREVKGAEEEKTQKGDAKKGESALKQFTVNLNEKAREGKVDPADRPRPEVDRTVQILCRRSKNNPLYVGEPGVGKTAIAEGWRARSSMARCRTSSRKPSSTRSTWARCSPAPAIAATSRSG
jgi:ATP-dependent Clp protease ATP-binding subunit ClpA